MQFSITKLLLENAHEFPLTPEWERLLYEEFYTQWLSDEIDMTDPVIYVEELYQAFLVKFNKAAAKLAPTFKAQNIEQLASGAYRVTLQVEGERIRKIFDTLDEARLFRNDLLKHPKVGGMMKDAFIATLNDARSALKAA
jgi:hypothetical protein